MKKVFFFLPLSVLFIITGCMIPRETQQPSITQATVKQVEAKAADISQAQALNFKEISGYFVKNNVRMTNDVNFFTVDSDKSMDAVLGVAKRMADVISMPDLRKNIVAVIAMKPSESANDIKVTKAYAVGSDIYIDYEIVPKESPEVGYFISNMKAVEIQRTPQITNVSFTGPDKHMTVMPFGKRSAGSPQNMQVLLKNYTGTYKGTIPAADGPGVYIALNLLGDYTFTMKQTYLSNPERVFESAGNWVPSDDLSSLSLNFDGDSAERMKFYYVDKNTIEKLDNNGERINSELYKLKK